MRDPNQFLGSLLILLGVLGGLAGIVLLRFPAAVRRGLAAFPRSIWPGRILAAVGVFWVAWVIAHAALGRFEGVKPFVPIMALLGFVAIIWLLDELLAPRMLGGLLLLLANPMLNGVRWADSPWRLVVVVVAYVWVLAGCVLMLHPWAFRRLAARLLDSPAALRAAGWGKLLAGVVLLLAGAWHLR